MLLNLLFELAVSLLVSLARFFGRNWRLFLAFLSSLLISTALASLLKKHAGIGRSEFIIASAVLFSAIAPRALSLLEKFK